MICLGIKKELSEIRGIPMDEDEESSPIVHNCQVNRKNLSESNGK